jgi:hypothetical protein
MEKEKPGKREMKIRKGEMENGKWKKTRRGGMENGKGEMEIRVYVMKSRKWKKGNLEKKK